MTIREMHYDFKQKLNRIDSQQNRDLKVPEIDWKLNEAQELFVKMVAKPEVAKEIGFEIGQRTIDDIRTIVVNQKFDNGIVPIVFDSDGTYLANLPDGYWFYIGSRVYSTKGSCKLIKMRVREVKHNDEAELSPFDKSSFIWRVVNIRFISEGIKIFTDRTFSVDKMCLEYLRQPRVIYNAADWTGGSYTGLDGVVYTGRQDSELPKGTHRDIVDLAVMITAGDLSLPDYAMKQNKVKMDR